MSLDSKHPQYIQNISLWEKNRDVYNGTEAVKAKEYKYLPATPGMELDGLGLNSHGRKHYERYISRSKVPETYREGVDSMIGLMHRKPCTIKLPKVLEPMRDSATIKGESLDLLLRRINTEQLCPGRLGLLLDFTTADGSAKPYIALYETESITNWDDSDDHKGQNRLEMVVLNESGPVRKLFEWEEHSQYRVLAVGQDIEEDEVKPQTYHYGVFQSQGASTPMFVESQMQEYLVLGKPLQQVPFVFINSRDTLATPDMPPLNGLANQCLTIYKAEADYRETLFQQTQETLVVIGGIRTNQDDELRIGSGARIETDQGGDVKYVGISGAGLTEQRLSLENDYKEANRMAGQVVNNMTQGGKESGEALRVRVAAQTATLVQVALAGGHGLQTLLRMAAVALNGNPDEVVVEPNTEFSETLFNPQEISQLLAARNMGVPLSLESIHALLVDKGITKLDYTTEYQMYIKEMENAGLAGNGTGIDDETPPEDE